jgi:hypothetical protein
MTKIVIYLMAKVVCRNGKPLTFALSENKVAYFFRKAGLILRLSEFAEKEYEGFLYRQLERDNPYLWSPDQVLESYLGFDRAAFLDKRYLFHLHRYQGPLPGVFPNRFKWQRFPKRLHNRLPRFRVNCFIQAKRPEFGSRRTKKLAALGSRTPYFKMTLVSDQQRTLEASAEKLQGRALFVYAAAAFWESQDLFRHGTQSSLVAHSTFPEVMNLKGHSAWYYNRPGAYGVVNRGFESRELPPLETLIERLVAENANASEERLTPSLALEELFKELQIVIRETEGVNDRARSSYLADEWRQIASISEQLELPTALTSFLGIAAFAERFNLIWLTVA